MASNSPRLVAVAALVALVETALRVAVGWFLGPAAAILVPPVAATVGFAAVVPGIRSALSDGLPVDLATTTLRSRFTTLASVAVLGHALAVAMGVALFVLVDTPVRAVLYWAGHGGLLSVPVQLIAPFWGVAAGTVVAWVLPAIAVEAAFEGASVRGSFAAARATVVDRPRTVLRTAGWHLVTTLPLSVPVALGLTYLIRSGSAVAFVAVAGVVGALVATLVVPALFVLHVGTLTPSRVPIGSASGGYAHGIWSRDDSDGADRRSDTSPSSGAVPFPALAAAALLVVGLVAGAGAVRVAELRPTDTAAEPLPEAAGNPDGLYATARANTWAADHHYRVVIGPNESEPFVVERRIDRTDRQYRQILEGQAAGPDVYADAGVGSPPTSDGLDWFALGTRPGTGESPSVRATPDYLLYTEDYTWQGRGGLIPPRAVEGWTVVDRGDGRVVLELTDPETVFRAVQGRPLDDVGRVNASRIRAVVDTDRGVLRRVDYRFDANVSVGDSTTHVGAHVVHTFETGIDVERPASVRSVTPGAWAWRLLVY